MTTFEMRPVHRVGAKLPRSVELTCFALLVANLVFLIVAFVQSWSSTAAHGAVDFVALWAAGRVALTSHLAAAYDWPTLKLVEESILGQPLTGYLPWPYPPTAFLLIAAPLSLLPYVDAFAIFVFGTFLAYAAAIRAIIGDRIGYFLAASFPAVLANFVVGQNGLLSAGLIGGALFLMERWPISAGALLGLLTYKPHLGLLFPLALIVSGRWRAFASAAVVGLLLAAASWVAFGSDGWQAFFLTIHRGLNAEALAYWGKSQSAFGFVLALGGSEALAWIVQIAVTLVTAAAIAVLWRSRASYELKAAALGTGALLATSHLFMYDLAILAVPLAFLFRLGSERGFLPYELAGMGLACLLILAFSFEVAPVGFVAVLVVAALVVYRVLAERKGLLKPHSINDRECPV